MSGSPQPLDKVCPRCKTRLRSSKATYCRTCSVEYEAERKAGLHKRGRLCAVCGEHYDGRGANELCEPCRKAYREWTCTRCAVMFWGRGRSRRCQACVREWAREWSRDELRKETRRDHRYGLIPGQYDRMMEDQNLACASCFQSFGPERSRTACVDHDRACCDFTAASSRPLCGRCIRGLLCWNCNVMLGNARDDPKTLHMGAEYLERWQSRHL